MRFELLAVQNLGFVVVACVAACGNDRPIENVIAVDAVLADFDGTAVPLSLNAAAHGEWWTCDLRLTTDACVDDNHVSVFVGLPVYDDFSELGGNRCVDEFGPSGVFEIMSAASSDELDIPGDLSGFVVAGADADDDGVLDTARAGELYGAAHIVKGTVQLFFVGTFEQELVLRISGTTDTGADVAVDFSGPMIAVGNPTPLEPSSTCK